MQSEPMSTEPDIVDLRVGVVSFSDLVPFVPEGVTPSRSTEHVLIAAFCGTCSRPVMRKIDIVGTELVIQPWEHYSPGFRITHPVGEICTEKRYD